MNQLRFWKTSRGKLVALVGTVLVGGGLALAHASLESAHVVNLKLAPADESPSHYTMAPAAKAAMPAVVKISASRLVKPTAMEGQAGPEGMDPFFQQFFGNGNMQQPRAHREGGLGSGVIISPDGYILTNNHVVDGDTDVRVTLPDRREFKAKVIGTDAKTDIAVLKIDATNLPVITVGNSSKLQIGDAVLAIGNPFGVGQTVTMGIVSATGRAGLGIEKYEDFIQTDASINPGNSGGALVNDRGELIGINTAILTGESGGNPGIGFAIPVNLARQVMDEIVTHGQVTRSYLGVMVQEVTPSLAKAVGLTAPDGALVTEVQPNSPAASAGIKSGDVITSINGTPIVESNQLRMIVSLMNPGQSVNMKVFRNGQTSDMTATVTEMPGEKVIRASKDNPNPDNALTGVQVQDLDSQSAHQLGLPPSTSGVVVTDVDPSSAAASAGLQQGDVIQSVNHQPVQSAQDFNQAVRKSSNGESLLLINRDGQKLYLAV